MFRKILATLLPKFATNFGIYKLRLIILKFQFMSAANEFGEILPPIITDPKYITLDLRLPADELAAVGHHYFPRPDGLILYELYPVTLTSEPEIIRPSRKFQSLGAGMAILITLSYLTLSLVTPTKVTPTAVATPTTLSAGLSYAATHPENPPLLPSNHPAIIINP